MRNFFRGRLGWFSEKYNFSKESHEERYARDLARAWLQRAEAGGPELKLRVRASTIARLCRYALR